MTHLTSVHCTICTQISVEELIFDQLGGVGSIPAQDVSQGWTAGPSPHSLLTGS